MNISDGVCFLCFIVGLLFFGNEALGIAGIWLAAFISSGLGLRRYCKGKGMMRYGTINDVDSEDYDAILSSYFSHRWTMVLCTLGVIIFTIYHLFQEFI